MTNEKLKLSRTSMPLVGFGTYLIKNEDIETIILEAFNSGYRHIDTTQAYSNEEGIGNAIKKAVNEGMLSREDLFITTKLWPGHEEWGQTFIGLNTKSL